MGNRPRRNRAKRRVREAVRLRAGALPPSLDFVFLARAESWDAPWEDLLADVEGLIHRLTARWDADSESS